MKPDLFLSPDGFLSLGANCKQLPVIHDINFLHNPKDVKPLTRKYYNYFFPKFAQKATRIATVSEFSKKDISENYKISSDKIDVVYNGINDSFKPVDEFTKEQTKKKFSEGKNYFLFVGAMNPRKNIPALITAFDDFKKETKSDFKLVLAGPHFYGVNDVYKTIDGCEYKNDIIFTGRLTDEDLAKVMASAFALTFVPYFEGFGIPLVEAMQCEVPVIVGNNSSMPEIGGKAILYADAADPDAIAKQMLNLYKDESQRTALIEEGKTRAADFSWDRSAELLWQNISEAVKN